ncbi:hypothetical protein EJ04DRAFT_297702 [Polyplosphaeria fusca]|uniref:Uncharacterized protein n=1 Tax=Polyplosphaeria fusca TaxID=682080 RepID=A0A9P4V018_9PLEO|nr:hypothetical protein EJ04DRAFT_297702 [Polyplosphaeria fusca]
MERASSAPHVSAVAKPCTSAIASWALLGQPLKRPLFPPGSCPSRSPPRQSDRCHASRASPSATGDLSCTVHAAALQAKTQPETQPETQPKTQPETQPKTRRARRAEKRRRGCVRKSSSERFFHQPLHSCRLDVPTALSRNSSRTDRSEPGWPECLSDGALKMMAVTLFAKDSGPICDRHALREAQS